MNIFDISAIKVFFAFAFGYFISYFDVATREAMLALIILSILDFVGAMLVIWRTEETYKSSRIADKAYKLVAHLVLIWIGALINNSIQVPTGYGIDDLLISWFGLAEGFSLMEKAKSLGIELPEWIFDKINTKKEELSNKL